MKHVSIAAAFLVALAGSSVPVHAQTTPQARTEQAAPAATGNELYHVHLVKAAPGKLAEMIDSYVNAPADPNASGAPIILRHVSGDDWDLLVLTPLGKQSKLEVTDSATQQQFVQRTRPLRAMHSDTFAVGPAWPETRTALAAEPKSGVVATSGSSAPADKGVYVVTTYRALPGHREQLEQVLRKLAAIDPARSVTLQHMEGAAWDMMTVSHYDSWTAYAQNEMAPDMEKLKAQGFTSPDGPSFALREHMAEHRDTLTVRVTK